MKKAPLMEVAMTASWKKPLEFNSFGHGPHRKYPNTRQRMVTSRTSFCEATGLKFAPDEEAVVEFMADTNKGAKCARAKFYANRNEGYVNGAGFGDEYSLRQSDFSLNNEDKAVTWVWNAKIIKVTKKTPSETIPQRPELKRALEQLKSAVDNLARHL